MHAHALALAIALATLPSLLPDKPSTFWTVDLFLDELTNLLEYFGIQKEFHLIGHSWGGMMGAEFVARRHPAGLRRLVIADSPAVFDLWTRSFRELVGGFPQHVQDALAKEVDEDRQSYFAAMLQVYAVHGCRVHPFPDELIKTLQYQYADDADRTVTDAGIIKNWTIIDRLHLVNVPTLIVNGQYDIAQDYVVEAYAEKIPDSRRLKFNSASHTPFWEDREAYMEAIAGFLSQ